MSDGQDFFERVGTDTRPPAPDIGELLNPAPPSGNWAPAAIKSGNAPAPAFAGDEDIGRWSTKGDHFWTATKSADRLPAGFYVPDHIDGIGAVMTKRKIALDNLVALPDTATERVMAEFDEFWALRQRFTDRGFLHKRGILLWGPPGSGKTSGLMQMSHEIVTKHDGLVVQIVHPSLTAHCLAMLRKIEPDRPIIAIMEDLDALVQRHGEAEFLALLDGETQVDRIVYVATTNYPERLDARFVDRPSRFDTIEYVGMPSAPARRAYLAAKEPSLAGADLERWIDRTDGFSVAHLRELVILVRVFGRPLEAALARLEGMRVSKPSSEDSPHRAPFGFKPAFGGGQISGPNRSAAALVGR